MKSAQIGNLLLLKFIHSIGGNIYQARFMVYPFRLRAAIKERQLQDVKWLIKHGAVCNTRVSDGQRPLFYAVTEGLLDIVRALVEEGGASLHVRDDCSRTAIGWDNDYAPNIMNFGIIITRQKIKPRKEIAKCTQERGCKEYSSTRKNNDA
jgi:hypothetical protein